jgi:hypothetical protein
MREELTQSLGLMQDAHRYTNSIFQTDWTTVTEFAPIDRALIYLLYDPRLCSGMRTADVRAALGH